jgi:hypothetical protein
MITRKLLISAVLLSSFALSSTAMAFDRDHSANHGGQRNSRDGAEMNNDKQFRKAQKESKHETGNGFKLSEIESGQPQPGDRGYFNYNYFNDMTRNHR